MFRWERRRLGWEKATTHVASSSQNNLEGVIRRGEARTAFRTLTQNSRPTCAQVDDGIPYGTLPTLGNVVTLHPFWQLGSKVFVPGGCIMSTYRYTFDEKLQSPSVHDFFLYSTNRRRPERI